MTIILLNMGQDHPQKINKKNGGKISQKNKQFQIFYRDPRLVQRVLFVPQLFAGALDSDIKKVQRLIDSIPNHNLETHIIDSINDRFQKDNKKQKSQVHSPQKSSNPITKPAQLGQNSSSSPMKNGKGHSQLDDQEQTMIKYYELETEQKFMELLKKFQHWFYIQKQLNSAIMMNKSDKKITVRKKVIPNYQTSLNKHLYAKIYLKYYLIILKKNLASKDRDRKNFMQQFHNSIGRMICQMIQNNHLQQKKLFSLTYTIVRLQKQSSKQNLNYFLSGISQQFKPIYLKKQHSLIVKPQQYERMRQITRLYLDQLYLKSLKQAEDPEIQVDGNEGFGVVKSFPVFRVRDQRKS